MRSSVLGDHKATASSYHNIGLVQCDIGDLKGPLDSFYAVATWPVTGQGFQNTKWPAVLYYQ